MAAWNEALLTTWNSQKSRWGASVKVEKMENSTLSTGLSNVSNEAEITGKLPAGASVEITPKVQKVLDHLERFPDDLKLSDRKLAVAAGVSHPIVAEARKHL
jgi:polyisoprenoid-binding protein YceI